MKIRTKKFIQNNRFKSVKIDSKYKNKLHIICLSKTSKKLFFLFFIILFSIIFLILLKYHYYSKKISQNINNFDYANYQKEIITDEIFERCSLNLTRNEIFFINGIIQKHKPKKCLEIGVGKGGISVLILNAIKDMKNSFLVSLDLNNKLKEDPSKKIGYKVEKYFSNLSQNWKLLMGEMPHKFLSKLNLKFNLAIIDTDHLMPGEILNIIEVMPFLEENAIIILPHLITHMKNVYNKDIDKNEIKKSSTSILLMSSLVGKKKIFYNENKIMGNVGAIFLEKNQEKYYENYFLLLLNIWESMLSDEQIFQFRLFIEKYYKKEKYINLFENAILYNKEYHKNYK